MAEQHDSGASIERIEDLSIVTLKVSSNSIEDARDRLQLASPLSASGSDPRSLWCGPDRWLLISSSLSADSMVKTCEEALADVLHNVVDYSAVSVGRLTQAFSQILKTTVSGNAQHYGLIMAAGAMVLLTMAVIAL